MIIDVIITELNKMHEAGEIGWEAFAEVPEGLGGKFVTVEMTGHSRKNLTDTATIAVQSWADSKADAADLSSDAIKAFMKLPYTESDISGVRLTNEYDFTDNRTKKYRYQAIYEITYFE